MLGYLVMRCVNPNNFTHRGMEAGIKEDGLVGVMFVYKSEEAARKAYPDDRICLTTIGEAVEERPLDEAIL